MKKSETIEVNQSSQNKVVFYAIQLVVLSIILVKCYYIIEPFLNILLWGFILAIALQPLHKKLTNKLKGKNIVASMIISISMLLLIIIPSVWLLFKSVEEVKEIKNAIRTDQLIIPTPNESVKEWPVVGAKIYTTWTELSTEKTSFIIKHKEELKPVALKLISLLSTVGKGILIFIGAIIIGGILLIYSESISRYSRTFFIKIAGEQGDTMNFTITSTIQNVAKGILGVAFLQSTLVGIGLVIAGVPLAGLWAVLCLLLAIVQIGIFPIAIGVIIYIWGSADTTTAVLLTIWIVFSSLIDNVIKPIVMGKGAPAPMLIVFMGTIGGFIANGFIGLFTGAIILTIVYNLMTQWININTPEKTLITEKEIQKATIEDQL
jgi:predicted PurR-regulated permease PerM